MSALEIVPDLDVAVAEAAGALAFVEAVPVEQAEDPAATGVLLELIAPRAGAVAFRMSAGDAAALSQVAWGALAAGSEEQAFEFLCEFANVVAGRLLADLHPGEPVRIGLPQRQGASSPNATARRVYDLEGWRLFVDVMDQAA